MTNIRPHCDTYLPEGITDFCPACQRPVASVPASTKEGIAVEKTAEKLATPQIAHSTLSQPKPSHLEMDRDDLLHHRFRVLERRVEELEVRSQCTNLMSPSFMTRAFAVFGHWIVAYLLLVLPLFLLGFCAGLLGRR